MTTIFTDGSSRGNPGPGGWGAVVVTDRSGTTHVQELGGGEKNTTNNRMELMAALNGILAAPKNSSTQVYTDSKYLIQGITKWIHGWRKNGWKTGTKADVLNRDIWEKLGSAVEGRTIEWKYVGGHIGIVGNERCDHIATAFADAREVKLFSGVLGLYDLPNILELKEDTELKTAKKKSSSSKNKPAFSYVSAIGGVIEIHKTWAECEKRVKGAKGAKFKKSMDLANEKEIIAEFQAL